MSGTNGPAAGSKCTPVDRTLFGRVPRVAATLSLTDLRKLSLSRDGRDQCALARARFRARSWRSGRLECRKRASVACHRYTGQSLSLIVPDTPWERTFNFRSQLQARSRQLDALRACAPVCLSCAYTQCRIRNSSSAV